MAYVLGICTCERILADYGIAGRRFVGRKRSNRLKGRAMAELTIRLRTNPETGKKDIVVSLRSDEDVLPMEHEQQHRELVDRLLENGLLSAGEAGQIVVEREEEAIPAAPVADASQAARKSQAQEQ